MLADELATFVTLWVKEGGDIFNLVHDLVPILAFCNAPRLKPENQSLKFLLSFAPLSCRPLLFPDLSQCALSHSFCLLLLACFLCFCLSILAGFAALKSSGIIT